MLEPRRDFPPPRGGFDVAIVRYLLACSAALALAMPAHGDFFEDLYRGLDILSRPSGAPLQLSDSGGLQNGSRFGRVRVVPNDLGGGYKLEFNRNFGFDSAGRPEILNIGIGELRLDGNTQFVAGYTNRVLPTLDFSSFIGNLNYTLRTKSGPQDLELTGVFNANTNATINALGFYDVTFEAANTDAFLRLEGAVIDSLQDADYDIGPISIRGNLFADIAIAALSSFGVETSGLEGAFYQSPIDRITDAIQAELKPLLDAQAQATLLAGQRVTSTLPPLPGPVRITADGPERVAAAPSSVPEPSSLLLIAAGLAACAAGRR
jgi:hypothetical protein